MRGASDERGLLATVLSSVTTRALLRVENEPSVQGASGTVVSMRALPPNARPRNRPIEPSEALSFVCTVSPAPGTLWGWAQAHPCLYFKRGEHVPHTGSKNLSSADL